VKGSSSPSSVEPIVAELREADLRKVNFVNLWCFILRCFFSLDFLIFY
jgi:hypothetical protein